MKPGAVAYCIRNYRGHKKVKRGIVSEIYEVNGKLGERVYGIGGGYIGERVFETAEEAEKALEMSKDKEIEHEQQRQTD